MLVLFHINTILQALNIYATNITKFIADNSTQYALNDGYNYKNI